MKKLLVNVDNTKSVHFLDNGTEIDILPLSIPLKFFHNDVVLLENSEFIIHESPVRDALLAGVLILNKTYGRSGRRLLYRCIPDNALLPSFLVPYDIPASFHKNVKNKYIVFRFDHWEDDYPRGEIKNTLGDVDSREAFEEYQLWRRGLQISLSNFSNMTRQMIKKTGDNEAIYIDNILEKNGAFVEDYRGLGNVFTIDPAGCTDFDDAFSVVYKDRFATVNVYIANVYLWLETYGLWEFVSDRVSTIYFPNRKVPMLPPLLSDSLCSLEQGHDRFAFMMSLKYDMTTKQQVGEPVYKNVLIRINKNYVYEDTKGLEKNAAYKVLRELALTTDSHEVVSFWMIKMNSECARYMSERGKGVFRGKSFKSVSTSEAITSVSEASKSVSEASKSVSEAIPSYLFEKCAITYEKEATPHTQLGLDAYVHITSPIRRLVDILNQILFQKDVSTGCQTFFDKWFDKLDQINRATKDIRRVQMDCDLLALCISDSNLVNREFIGIVFDKEDADNYMVYVEELKLVSRVKSSETIPNGLRVKLKIYMFHDEHKLCKKVRCAIIKETYGFL
jgi:exoribonuclease R